MYLCFCIWVGVLIVCIDWIEIDLESGIYEEGGAVT